MSPDTSETTLADLKVGDRVQVFGGYGRRRDEVGGQDGEVIKVGRKLITVAYPGNPHGQVFRLESGRANDDYGHQRIKTIAQAEEDLHREDLVQRLKDGGLEVRMGRQLSTRALEAVAMALDESEIAEGGGSRG